MTPTPTLRPKGGTPVEVRLIAIAYFYWERFTAWRSAASAFGIRAGCPPHLSRFHLSVEQLLLSPTRMSRRYFSVMEQFARTPRFHLKMIGCSRFPTDRQSSTSPSRILPIRFSRMNHNLNH